MFLKFAKKIFGSANDRFINKLQQQVLSINKLEKEYEKLTNQELKNKTKEFKLRLKQKETLDTILIEAFATVREASKNLDTGSKSSDEIKPNLDTDIEPSSPSEDIVHKALEQEMTGTPKLIHALQVKTFDTSQWIEME